MNKAQVFLKKHSSTILTVVGSAGVIGTAVLAVKATPKALQLIEKEKQSRKEYSTIFADSEPYETVIMPELTPLEIVKVAWKPYIPAVITGVSTIACIFGVNMLNKRQQAALMSAYAVLDSAYKEYRKKAEELLKDEDIKNIKHEIVKTKIDKDIKLDDDKELFFDFQSMRHFESTFSEVLEAERVFNGNFMMSGYSCLNDYYELLGLPPVDYGYQIGWSATSSNEDIGLSELEFQYEKTIIDDGSEDGLECWVITMPYPPSVDYVC